ncbi:9724_t:CDS:1, partial [Entrophospora sp. SA101]
PKDFNQKSKDKKIMLPIDQEIRSKNVIANPGPLGLSAFAMTTFVYSMFSVEVLDIKIPQVGLGLALFYGGFIQLLAGMWEMKNGNTFGATVFSSYGKDKFLFDRIIDIDKY